MSRAQLVRVARDYLDLHLRVFAGCQLVGVGVFEAHHLCRYGMGVL